MNNSKPNPTNAISRDAIVRKWPMYQCLVRDRLIVGADSYGDTSFLRPPSELLSEIAEELMDVTGWAFILWTRVQEMQQTLEEQKKE